ncbi:unnamed protein product [Gadus morhua 'NCC']
MLGKTFWLSSDGWSPTAPPAGLWGAGFYTGAVRGDCSASTAVAQSIVCYLHRQRVAVATGRKWVKGEGSRDYSGTAGGPPALVATAPYLGFYVATSQSGSMLIFSGGNVAFQSIACTACPGSLGEDVLPLAPESLGGPPTRRRDDFNALSKEKTPRALISEATISSEPHGVPLVDYSIDGWWAVTAETVTESVSPTGCLAHRVSHPPRARGLRSPVLVSVARTAENETLTPRRLGRENAK